MKTTKGKIHFFSETGTEGGSWAFQDEAHIKPDGSWSYDGLHILKNGDHLTILNPQDGDPIWDGIISLEQFPVFSQAINNLWVHSAQKGISKQTWMDWFSNEYPAVLEKYEDRFYTELPYDEFNYFEEERFPLLVLGQRHDSKYYNNFVYKNPEKWVKIAHQTCGHACHQVHLTGMILTPTNSMKQLMKRLNDHWLDSNVGVFGVSLNSLNEYHNMLATEGLDCQHCHTEFEEAIYPIDLPENLNQVCTDELPKELDDLVDFESNMHKFLGCVGRWRLYVLGENCD